MGNRRVGILTECVCDLPQKLLSELGVEIIYFLVKTDSGTFQDTTEITSENMIAYMSEGRPSAISTSPDVCVYRKKYEKMLEKYEEIIHISISRKVSDGYSKAEEAIAEMGDASGRIHLFDSEHLSSGMGLLVIKAARLVNAGYLPSKIIKELTSYREHICTTFISPDIHSLYVKHLVSKKAYLICKALNIHPVLIIKNGKMSIKRLRFGDYDKASRRYIRCRLKGQNEIDKEICMLTHAGCSSKTLDMLKNEIGKYTDFNNIQVTSASASVTSNCGKGTFGVIYVK